jgi:stress response protein SCP2
MAIDLKKGQRIELGLERIGIGLGWDPNEGTGHDFDLDASAFFGRQSEDSSGRFLRILQQLEVAGWRGHNGGLDLFVGKYSL